MRNKGKLFIVANDLDVPYGIGISKVRQVKERTGVGYEDFLRY